MNAWPIITLLAAHFIGDWILQSRSMATNKYKNVSDLISHLVIVHFCIFIALVANCHITGQLIDANKLSGLFVNIGIHGAIDWNIWRIYGAIRGEQAFSFIKAVVDDEEQLIAMQNASDKTRLINHDYWFYTTIAVDQFLHLAILFLLFL